MLKLAIFDVDGTLVDSQGAILSAMAAGHEAAGLEMPPRETVLGIVGLSLPIAMARLHPDEPAARVERLTVAYKHAYKSARDAGDGEATTPFFPGARDALDRLDRAGWLLAIATGKARRGLAHMLEAHDLGRLFVATQTADDAPSKPHPAMIENILRETGADPAGAVMIGDTRFDLEMALNARVASVGVSWGYHPVEALAAAAPHSIVEDFGALDAALDAALTASCRGAGRGTRP
ncbi:MAG: HAD-IA family hydrolase [Pseudomonadota bacterium]